MPTKTNEQIVTAYIKGVLSGRVVAGQLVRAACQRQVDDLAAAKKRGFYFDKAQANRAIDFARGLTHSTGEWEGKPFELTPFQKFITWCLFGWRRSSDDTRRYRRAFVSLGSGNGKSPFGAFVLLLCWAFDEPTEPRAEGYCISTKLAQSRIVFDEVKRFRNRDPYLKALIGAVKDNLHIVEDGSKLQPLGADGSVDDGLVPHVVVVDELHRWREHHREWWDMITSKMAKRRQPLLLVITTAGDDTSELWEEQYDLARKVVERGNNIEVDELFVFIAQIDDQDDPLDEANWPKANPMLEHGVVKIDALRSAVKMARVDPRQKNRITRLNMNRKVSSGVRALTSEMWARGDVPLPPLDGLRARAGFDWGWKADLTSMVYVFPLAPMEVVVEHEGETKTVMKRRVAVKADTWIPEGGARNLAEEPWASWIRDGWLVPTPGEITDVEAVYATIRSRQEVFGIQSVAVDPNNAREFGERVQRELGVEAFWFGQTCGKFNEPTRELISMCHEGRLVHGGNPLLAWAMLNVILKTDSRGYQMPDKRRVKDKIDPAVALIMGLSEVMFAEAEPTYYYEDNDVEAG